MTETDTTATTETDTTAAAETDTIAPSVTETTAALDDPEDRKDGILEVGGEEVSADEADPDYTEYMTGEGQYGLILKA